MKKLNLLAIIVGTALVFSSCSSEESSILEVESPQLLKKYKVEKDAQGKYYLGFDFVNDVKVDKVFDETTKTSQFYFYPTNTNSEKSLSEELPTIDSRLKIGFVDTNLDKRQSITIIDDNITFAKGKQKALKTYKVSNVEGNLYELDFVVANNITVDFLYNQSIETYEIHLKKGKSEGKKFSRSFEKEDGKPLKIDFVDFTGVMSAKTESTESSTRKPRIIIDDD